MSILTLPGNPLQDLPLLLPRKTIAELLQELGDIPAERVRLFPYPGTATEEDSLSVNEQGGHCELVDGTLVELPMSFPADYLGFLIATILHAFIAPRRLGLVVTARAQFRMIHGNIREPDASFTRRERIPKPLPTVGGWCPDLCIEILSPGNTAPEMSKKRTEYFASGCQLVWEIDPESRTATVYIKTGAPMLLDPAGILTGDPVLPGFQIPLAELFQQFDELTLQTE